MLLESEILLKEREKQTSERKKMGKRLRTSKSISSCKSPRCSYNSTRRSTLNCYEEDAWTYIARFLDGKSLVMLAATSKWFNDIIMQESIWKFMCMKDLQVPAPNKIVFSWIKLYASAADGTHTYSFRQKDKHIDWMRIGAFCIDSPVVLLTDNLHSPMVIPKEESVEKALETNGACLLKNVKTGIWIADLQLVQCPACDQSECDGTMQTLDARHIELFLCEGYQNGTWDYENIGCHKILNTNGASGAILSVDHLKDPLTASILDLKSWIGKPNDWQPKAVITFHSVAVNTNLQKNEGLVARCQVMKAGADGEIISIRLSQQLL